ncbi:MAG: ROK family protein [Ardenticatenaceae bacterium]|nr:ROK family protein [Ardenticatenaceae bacterium]MCB8987404.1 ROK family protein [Ardenticatenaceae bacterium]
MKILGIDIGGSGIKGALVDTDKGKLLTDRLRIPTPQPAKPKPMINAIRTIVQHFDYEGPIGVGFPGVVVDGVTRTAANIHDDWIDYPAARNIALATNCETVIRNDADVAGYAEMFHGAGRGVTGVVMIFTLGTGIGSVMFVNGQIVPNLELGHLYLRDQKKDAEFFAADRVREEKDLSWEEWGERLNVYFQHIEFLFSPNLVIIGGGVSKKHQKFLKYINLRADLVPAQLRNEAGIIGAAMAALPK